MIKENRKNTEMIVESVKNLKESNVRNFKDLMTKVTCPPPWQVFRYMCLRFVQENKTWKEAQKDCVARGGDLSWIESKEEHQVINKFFKEKLSQQKNNKSNM